MLRGVGVRAWRTGNGGPELVIPVRRARARRAWASARRAAAATLSPVLVAGTSLVPAAAVVTAASAGAVAASVAAAPAARAATLPSVLVVLVNGESSAPEVSLLSAAGYTVTTASPATLAAMSQSTFKGYAAVVVGDSSSGSTCSTTAPSTATLGSQWEPWVTGNVAVLGTAPVLAAGLAGSGQKGADALITGAAEYAAVGYNGSTKTGTGLYVSLNCAYKSSAAGTAVPLLSGVPGMSADPVTVQGGFACTDSGTVNQWGTGMAGTFSGFTSSELAAGSSGSWPSTGCPVQEAFDSWPANFTPAAFDASSNSDAAANFTASDGVTGQPYMLLGSPAPTTATLALTPSTGGAAPVGAFGVSGNAADRGLTQATAGDPVDTENGDFTQDDTDLSVPTFGPDLTFERTYDAELAQQQEQTGTPGPLGYGWNDNWATSLSTGSPIPGNIYALDGLAGAANSGEGLTAYAANGQAPASAPLGAPSGMLVNSGNTYYADTQGNRVIEVPGTSGTQWGISMTAGEAYTIAGSYTGQTGLWADQTGPATNALLANPEGLAMDSSGDLFIANAGGEQVDKVTPSGTMSTVAGTGSLGLGADAKAATSSALDDPAAVAVDSAGDVYIADSGNNRIQEVFASGGQEWGQSMTAGDIYTVAGSSSGASGRSTNGTAGGSSKLNNPQGITIDGSGDMYIADTGNNRVAEIPKSAGTNWNISMTGGDVYDVAGSAAGTAGHTGDGASAYNTALLSGPRAVTLDSASNMMISDTGNNRVQFVPKSSGTQWNQSVTANDMYTIAGSSAGTAGNSGNGGLGTSALLHAPTFAATFSSGKLWIADTDNNTIRYVSDSTFDISAYAGDGQDLASAGNGGPAVNGQLIKPGGEVADSHGDLYVTDSLNNRVEEIAAYSHTQWGIAMTGGDAYTIAGSATGVGGNAGDGGSGTSALLSDPQGLAFDSHGNLLIADFGNNQIRELAVSSDDISTFAGSTAGASGTTGDGGLATSGLLQHPYGLAVDASGDVYIADKTNNRIQEIYEGGQSWGQSMTAGDIYTVAGNSGGTSGDSGDGGLATSGLLSIPQGLAVDAAGDLIIADTGNEQVRMIPVATGTYYGQKMTKNDIYTLAGSTAGTAGYGGDGGPSTASLLYTPIGLAVDPAGDVYIADGHNDRIREIANAGGAEWSQLMNPDYIYTVAGTGTASDTGNGGPAMTATVYYAVSSGTDNYGDLYIGDQSGGQLREVTSATPATIHPAPGLTSALYPAPGSAINGTTYPGGITVTQPGGAQVTFYPQTSGTCAQPLYKTGSYCVGQQFQTATLTENGTSSYTFTAGPGDDAYTYSATTGLLSAVADPGGNTVTVASNYPAPGAATSTTAGTWPATSTAITCPSTATSCQTIISASGRALVIGSNASGQITSVTDPMGRQWTYGYGGSDLTSATDPMTGKTTYTYDTGNANPVLAADLLTITGPDAQSGYSGPDANPGADTVNVYNAAGQVTKQTDPMGYVTTFNYCPGSAPGGCLDATTGSGQVDVQTDGNNTIDFYDQGVLAGTTQWTGAIATGTMSFQTDSTPDTAFDGTDAAETLRDTNTTDGDANLTAYQYGNLGNQTQVTSPSGGTTPTGIESTTSGYPAVTTQDTADLDVDNCDSTAEATVTCLTNPGPAPVSSGGTITSPASAPPLGLTWSLYDDAGNQLYATTGVYSPSGSYEYSKTTYQLFKGNSITLNSTNISCTYTPPSVSLPCATINADGVVTQLEYNAQGDLISSSTPDGNSGGQLAATTDTYDGDGEQLTQVTPDGNVSGANAGNYTTVTAYNADGLVTSDTDGGGSGHTVTPRVTSYGWDGDGNQVSETDPRGYVTGTAFNADDEQALVTDPDGHATLTCYDGDGDVAQTVPATGVAANSLTAASCPVSYPAGYSDRLAADATVSTFNALGKMTQQTTAAPAAQSGYETTSYTYDANGNVLTTSAPASASGGAAELTVDTYDTAGALASESTGVSGSSPLATVSYCYDPDGQQTSVVGGEGNASVTYAGGIITGLAACQTTSPWTVAAGTYPTQSANQTTDSYDSVGRLVSTTSPVTATSTATTTSTYDPAGNTLTSTDPDGVTTTWAYDPLNLSTSVTYSGSSAPSVSWTYDAEGQTTSMTDGTGTTTYVTDPFGMQTSITNGAGQTVSYGYDADGDTTTVTYPLPSTASWAATKAVTYGYDNADELTSVTDFNNSKITISNTPDGLPTSDALGATGDTISTTYDATDAPSLITLKSSTATLQSFTYADAPAGDVLSETDTPASAQTPAAYQYDAKNRVTSMTPGTGSAMPYTFDASGDLTTLPGDASTTYNDGSQLTSSVLAGTTTAYAYNADGERLTAKQGSTTINSGTWNGAGRLTSYSSPTATMTTAAYNGIGLREDAVAGATQAFVWGAYPVNDGTPALLMDSGNAYIYGTGGTAPAEQVSLSSGAVTYLDADALGSVRGVVSGLGALTAAASYDAWGNPVTAGGLTAFTPFGFAGGYTDPTGLVYLINRYYDPRTGQFTSVDPDVAETLEPYAYTNGNPVSDTDPAGLCGKYVNCPYYLYRTTYKTKQKGPYKPDGHYEGDWHICGSWDNNSALTLNFTCTLTVTVSAEIGGGIGWANKAGWSFNISWSFTVTVGVTLQGGINAPPHTYGDILAGATYFRWDAGVQRKLCGSQVPCGNWSKTHKVTVQHFRSLILGVRCYAYSNGKC
jgi:RHS repeat-associated protein